MKQIFMISLVVLAFVACASDDKVALKENAQKIMLTAV